MPMPYCPKHGYAHPNCRCEQVGSQEASGFAKGGEVKDLRSSYNMSKGGKNMGCKNCMAMGGKCMAHGGEVENEKMHPEAGSPAPESRESGSVVDEILHGRKKMASGGMLEDAGVEDDFDYRMDLEPVPTREDEEHDMESGSKDDMEIVGQILKERKMRRRG